MLLSWPELVVHPLKEPEWLIEPYVYKEGITFMWGRSNLGKSPVAWQMARAIGEGTSFFGLPTRQGRVLFVELDTPLPGVAHRLRIGVPSPNVSFLFMKPLSIPAVSGEEERQISEARDKVEPDLVIINTLRKCHSLDDKDSRTSKEVYGWWQHRFKRAGLMFIHHPKKRPTSVDAVKVPLEDFSGTQAFYNDAQVALKLEPSRSKETNLRLRHAKGQSSRKVGKLPLHLDVAGDGTTVRCPKYEALLGIYELLSSGESASFAEKKGFPRSEIELVESGDFPGLGWLGIEDDDEAE